MSSSSPYAQMSSKDKNLVLFVCFSSAIAFFDFLIYLYIADVISLAFFPVNIDSRVTRLQGLGLFAVGYLARPLGAILFGRLGDTLGRKPILLYSMLTTTTCMLAMAFLPTYAQWGFAAPVLFIILRMIQGMAFGVYVPLTWIFVAEHLPRRYLSVGCSFVAASFFVGVLFSNAFFVWLTDSMTAEQLLDSGWRLPFIIGTVLSFLPLLFWRFITESPLFIDMQTKTLKHTTTTPFSLLFKHCKHNLFLSSMLSLLVASMAIVIALLLPNLIELRFALDDDLVEFSHDLGIIFMVFGCIFYGILSNRENFGMILMIGSLLLIAQIFAFYYHLQASGDYILFMYALLGFLAGIIGMIPAIFIRLFPINVRLTGISLSYNITYAVVGGILPFALGYATMYISFSPALYIAFVGAIGVMVGFYFYQLPESQPIDRTIFE